VTSAASSSRPAPDKALEATRPLSPTECSWCGKAISGTPTTKRRGRRGDHSFCSRGCKNLFFREAREIGVRYLDGVEGPAMNWRTNFQKASNFRLHPGESPPRARPGAEENINAQH
jgi:hypothetical protein